MKCLWEYNLFLYVVFMVFLVVDCYVRVYVYDSQGKIWIICNLVVRRMGEIFGFFSFFVVGLYVYVLIYFDWKCV